MSEEHDPDPDLHLCRRCGGDFRHIGLAGLGPCAPGGAAVNTISLLYLTRRRNELTRRRLIRELKEFGC